MLQGHINLTPGNYWDSNMIPYTYALFQISSQSLRMSAFEWQINILLKLFCRTLCNSDLQNDFFQILTHKYICLLLGYKYISKYFYTYMFEQKVFRECSSCKLTV